MDKLGDLTFSGRALGESLDHPSTVEAYWFFSSLAIDRRPPHREPSAQPEPSFEGDTLVFHQDSGVLQLAVLQVPETNAAWESWRPVLENRASDHAHVHTSQSAVYIPHETCVRIFDPAGSNLACVRSEAIAENVKGFYRLASTFGLIYGDAGYLGWFLDDPVSRLCTNEAYLHGFDSTPAPTTIQTVADIVELVHEGTMEKLYAGDPEIGRQLEGLRSRLSGSTTSPNDWAILDWISVMQQQWFD